MSRQNMRNASLEVPDGIVGKRRKLFTGNDYRGVEEMIYHHKRGHWRAKTKAYPIVNTRTPERPAMLFSRKSYRRDNRSPSFYVTVRAYPPIESPDALGRIGWMTSSPNELPEKVCAENNYWVQRTKTMTNQNDNNSSSPFSNKKSTSSTGSSEIMSVNQQIVRFSANSPSSDTESMKEANLVIRLEQELTQAQICNHRLNQQLKVLANSSDKAIKLELAEAKKQAKERLNEVDQLKKQNSRLAKEREMWLTKQPQDVTALLAEKQELRKQLDREQSEKQELFLQINSMIAKLADSEDQEEVRRLKNDLKSIQRELEEEKRSSGSEISRLKSEINALNGKIQNSLNESDNDKESMEQEIESLNRQLNIKTASLQSLMLAKADTGVSEALREENEQLKAQMEKAERTIAEVKRELVEKNSAIEKFKDVASMSEVSRNNLKTLEEKFASINQLLEEEREQKSHLHSQTEQLKAALSSSETALSSLRVKIGQFEESAQSLKAENERLRETQRDATLSDGAYIKELKDLLNEERDNNSILNVQLREKDGKIDRLQVELLSAQSKAQQAEEDSKQTKVNNLQSQTDSSRVLQEENMKTKQKLAELEEELNESKRSVRQKDEHLHQLETMLDDSKKRLEATSAALVEREAAQKESQKQFDNQKKELEHALESQKKQYAELMENQKILESKSSVADEIATLMSSLNSLRQDNNQYEEDIRGLQNEIRALREELYEQQDKRAYWEESAQKATSDLEAHKKRAVEFESSKTSDFEKLESEKAHLESALEKALEESELAKRSASEETSKFKRELMESNITLERESQSLKEKVERLSRELESSRKLIEKMQDDQCKLISSQDKEKHTSLADLQEAKEEMNRVITDRDNLKLKNSELVDQLKYAEETCERMRKTLNATEEKMEDTMKQLHAAEDLADRLQEAQILSGNVESKFASFKTENETRMEKVLEEHKNTVKQLKEELERSQREHASLESVLEDQQKECETLQEQLRDEKENAEVMGKLEKLEKIREKQEGELKDLRSSQAERQRQIEELQGKVSELTFSNGQLLEKLEILNADLERSKSEKATVEKEIQSLKNESSNGKGEIDEINAENARLAGELLKFHSSAEKSLQEERDRISKQFEERLKAANMEKVRLASELQMNESKRSALESETRELQSQLENAEKRRRADIQQLDYLREELHQVKNETEKLKAAGPIAPPRSNTRTISNMSAMTNWTQADFSECEDLTRLRSEIDKQKRLIIVLRRKLQGLQQ